MTDTQTPQTYILFGASGSGKGTQAELLKGVLEGQGHSVSHIQTGILNREYVTSGKPLAEQIREHSEKGKLTPSLFISKMLVDAVMDDIASDRDIILDGYPRTVVQADMLHDFLVFAERPYTVLYIDVPKDSLRERMKGRGRADDTDESIENRLAWFYESEQAMLEFWRSNDVPVYDIDGTPSIDAIHKTICTTLSLTP